MAHIQRSLVLINFWRIIKIGGRKEGVRYIDGSPSPNIQYQIVTRVSALVGDGAEFQGNGFFQKILTVPSSCHRKNSRHFEKQVSGQHIDRGSKSNKTNLIFLTTISFFDERIISPTRSKITEILSKTRILSILLTV